MSEPTKQCGKCGGVLPAASFHKRAASIDGLSACCKVCQRIYDRARLHKPDRVESRMLYRTTETGQLLIQAGQKRWQNKHSVARQAHVVVGNAVRDGRLAKLPCEVCGDTEVHGHHDDYTKPLEVRWMCNQHHIEHHMRERDRANGVSSDAI